MASTDFTELTDDLPSGDLARGVTRGVETPSGGEDYTFAFNMTTGGATGAAGMKYTAVNFDPMTNGGRISSAIIRLPSGGAMGFAPMIFMSLQGNSVEDSGYLLGLQDDDPSYIVLRKGSPVSGLPAGDADPLVNGLLRRSTASYANNTWLHLRLTVEVQGTGDVVITCEQSDLDAHDVDSPVWVAIPGMDVFVDDVTEINTGSAPFVGGRSGFAFYTEDITRRAAFDHVTIERQL